MWILTLTHSESSHHTTTHTSHDGGHETFFRECFYESTPWVTFQWISESLSPTYVSTFSNFSALRRECGPPESLFVLFCCEIRASSAGHSSLQERQRTKCPTSFSKGGPVGRKRNETPRFAYTSRRLLVRLPPHPRCTDVAKTHRPRPGKAIQLVKGRPGRRECNGRLTTSITLVVTIRPLAGRSCTSVDARPTRLDVAMGLEVVGVCEKVKLVW